eukprot:3562156-Alexandrium_andersonii.AAC.1
MAWARTPTSPAVALVAPSETSPTRPTRRKPARMLLALTLSETAECATGAELSLTCARLSGTVAMQPVIFRCFPRG